jgi:NAD(P)-dependent dehydrogenase (short-subunit alcohol dehydrogenase family)
MIVEHARSLRETMSLKGKQVVIVGGSSGIGLAVAESALDEGAFVLVASNHSETVDRAWAELASRAPSRTAAQILDVASEDAIEEFFADIGRFDHLIYTAGENLPLGPLASQDLDVARARFGIRYWGAVAAVKHAASTIREGGSIVLTSGFSAIRPRPGWTSQASIQCAVEGLTRALAVELAPIRVNCVSPGLTRTPRWDALSDGDREALYAREEQRVPLGRVGEAGELAAAYVYFMKNTYATGNILGVDGGASLV